MAEQTRKSINEYLWSQKHLQFYDHVYNDNLDTTFTLTQIFLLSLPFSPLNQERGLFVLNQVEERLLTPFGLRSLSSDTSNYKGRLYSFKHKVDSSYYTGSIWPWTIALYVDAVFNFRGEKRQTIENLKKAIETLGDFYLKEGLGNISTFFEGDAPYRRNGQICSSLNLTELLRAYYTIHRAEKELEGFSEYI